MKRGNTGKWVGLILGCIVVGVMLFMMFAILGNLLSGD
jgi:tetrahydromethanopterin S-methyltransferase subunit G